MTNHYIKGLVAACLLAAASMANAQSVTFNLSGTIEQHSCDFTIPDTDIGTYDAGTFTGVGYTTPWSSDIPISVANCTEVFKTVHMAFSGVPDSTNAQLFKAIPVAGQGNISGVAIDLSTASGSATSIAPNAIVDWDLLGIGYVFSLKARFSQTMAAVTPGVMRSPITVQFTYD